jgi:hypothetical protein
MIGGGNVLCEEGGGVEVWMQEKKSSSFDLSRLVWKASKRKCLQHGELVNSCM